MNSAGTYGCGADDLVCLCAKVDWGNSIHDCAKECAADAGVPAFTFAQTECQRVGVAMAAVPADVPAATPAPEVTPAPNLTPTPTPTPTPAATPTPETNVAAVPTETPTSEATPTPTPSEVSSSATPVSTETSTATEAASTSTASDDDQEAAPVAGGGMSQGAKVGLGVGISAVVMAFIGVGLFIFMRNRRGGSKDVPSMNERYKISPPIPSPTSQSPYTHDNGSSVYDGANGSSGDLKAFRYEEMVPRVQPRQMV
ncbi:hypothetical protein QBC44DRAFT_127328 [Cladorrhinum sp. PSN332]|nr:hypothetical protein QBC44DRAFT_127328 [Cladorrhinum sp. PSN332]